MKPVRQVSAPDVSAVTTALRSALDGGPAVWPVGDGSSFETSTAQTPQPAAAEPAWVVDDRVALVVETSGSTDAPKRVLLSADALRASTAAG